MLRETFDSEARLSYVLAALAGVLGATAFTHSAGYFVTFMTGNAQRAVLGYFRDDVVLSISAGLLIVAFVSGVVVSSVCRRHFWVAHPHGPTVLHVVQGLLHSPDDLKAWPGNDPQNRIVLIGRDVEEQILMDALARLAVTVKRSALSRAG